MAKLLSIFRVTNRSAQKTSTHTWKRLQYNRVKKFVGSLHWFHIPISLVLTFVVFQQFRRFKRREELKNLEQNANTAIKPIYIASDIRISMYKLLPLRTISRMWGWINSIELPIVMRSPILRSYVRAFGCNLDEADIDDLRQYKNLGEFFRRSLKPGLRPIDTSNGIVSPSDGTILYFGKANEGQVEQVKGITYTLQSFLGPQSWSSNKKIRDKALDLTDYHKSLLMSKEKQSSDLYHCVIYLAPGDYHRFHSPAEWQISYRRHFPGKLLSVRPTFAQWFPNLFNVNERVIYVGKWKYGFFSMTAVGATNVGSVKVYFDNDLATNQKGRIRHHFNDLKMKRQIHLGKGDPFGEFNLGSTIVLVFEAPKGMQFEINSGQKIKYGQLICGFEEHSNDSKSRNNATKGA